MFGNYIRTALRNFKRDKSSFLINVTGLSMGLACSILILLWVLDERSVDKFHEDVDQIYQVMEHQAFSENINTTISTPGVLAAAFKEEIPDFEYAAVYTWSIEQLFSVGETSLKTPGIYASPDIFNILTFDILEGYSENWLIEPNTIVLSRNTAQRYFGNEPVLGRELLLNNDKTYTVVGVYDEFPSNSTFNPGYIMPFEDFIKDNDWVLDWGNNGPRTIVKLRDGVAPDRVNEKITNFIREKSEIALIDLFIYPYAERYLYGRFENRQVVGGRIEYVRMFSVVALFVLLIACINFMNLSTARSTRRAKEIGIRKSIGADRSSLIVQHLSESVIISFFSLLAALLLIELIMPVFNTITGKSITFSYGDPFLMFSLLCIVLVTGIIAGSYPALYLSAFEAVKTLKGSIKSSAGELFARKGLVVFQFTLSIILIVSTILVYNQLRYVQSKHLGYEKENLIFFPLEGEANSWWNSFKQEAQNLPEVAGISRASSRFLFRWSNTYGVSWPGKDPDSSPLFEQVMVDYDLIETLGFEVAEGRTFSGDFGADSTKVIVNETAVAVMNLEEPVGQTIQFWNRREWDIIGVVRDFHFQNLRFDVEPLFMVLSPENTSIGFIRVQSDRMRETLARLEDIHRSLNPAFPFEYSFMDREYESLYASEVRVGKLSKYFALFAVIISCLGLFGLAAFTAEQRRKEIGIRKVLGATIAGVTALLSRDFVKLVLISNLIAWPFAWYFMNRWLQEFAYRIEIGWWVFVLAGGLALMIALLTVSTQAIKAALSNPVESLRYE
jgi:putative ABC transport system permease protein